MVHLVGYQWMWQLKELKQCPQEVEVRLSILCILGEREKGRGREREREREHHVENQNIPSSLVPAGCFWLVLEAFQI